MWPDDSPPFPGFNVKWGTIEGTLSDQADLSLALNTHTTDIATNAAGIATNAADIATETTNRIADVDAEEAARIAADALKVDLAGDTMDSGADLTFAGGGEVLGLPASPSATGASSKEYTDTQDGLRVATAGDSMDSGADLAFSGGGEVTGLPATPSATAASSKEYVDTKSAAASDDGLAFAIAFGG